MHVNKAIGENFYLTKQTKQQTSDHHFRQHYSDRLGVVGSQVLTR